MWFDFVRGIANYILHKHNNKQKEEGRRSRPIQVDIARLKAVPNGLRRSLQAKYPVRQMKRMNKWGQRPRTVRFVFSLASLPFPFRSFPFDSISFHTDCDCYFADSQFNGEEHVHIIVAKQLHSSVFVCVLRICIWLAAYLYLCIHILQLAGRAMSQLACQPLVGPRSSFKWFWNWFHLIANYNILLWHILTTSGMSYMRTL